jgi:hypothetical protein
LTNMNLMKQGQLNVAGSLLFAKAPQYVLPAFIVKAVAFVGTHIEDQRYIDSRDITGKLADVFQQTLGFIIANTRAEQGEQGFNSQGQGRYRAPSGKNWSPTPSSTATTSSAPRYACWSLPIGSRSSAPGICPTT